MASMSTLRWLGKMWQYWLGIAAILCAAVFICCPRWHDWEWRAAVAGTALQVCGLLTVWMGFEATRRLFGRPSAIAEFMEWWRERPRGVTHTGTGAMHASGSSTASGIAQISTGPGQSTEQRLDWLEREFREQGKRLSEAERRISIEALQRQQSIADERDARANADKQLSDKLVLSATGGLRLSVVGVLWMITGGLLVGAPLLNARDAGAEQAVADQTVSVVAELRAAPSRDHVVPSSHWFQHALDPLAKICDEWCLHFWEVVGIWFTGIATFAAVLVSLALARREGIRMTVSAGVRDLVRRGSEPPFPEVLSITVRNIGSRPAPIEGIAWRRRPWSSRYVYQLFDAEGGFPGPPITVDVGKSATFMLPLSDRSRVQWGDEFLHDFAGRYPNLGLRLVQVRAWTPAGHRCSAFLESSLRQWIIDKITRERSRSRTE
jgi:hypothetical protein